MLNLGRTVQNGALLFGTDNDKARQMLPKRVVVLKLKMFGRLILSLVEKFDSFHNRFSS